MIDGCRHNRSEKPTWLWICERAKCDERLVRILRASSGRCLGAKSPLSARKLVTFRVSEGGLLDKLPVDEGRGAYSLL